MWGPALLGRARHAPVPGSDDVARDVAVLEAIVREACEIGVEDDGLRFDVTTVAGERVKENA